MRRGTLAAFLLALACLAAPLGAQTGEPPLDSIGILRLSPVALRYLRLTYAAYGNREYAACLLGTVTGDTVTVLLAAPADVDPDGSDSVGVRTMGPCRSQWPHVVGVAHNHPAGAACSHRLHGTQVPTSDWFAFRRELVSLSLIICGDSAAVIDRAGRERKAGLLWGEDAP